MPLETSSLCATSLFEFRDLLFPYSNLNRLCDCFFFIFVFLCHIVVRYTNIFFCERFNFNPFTRKFLHFTITVLNWYDFISYSIVLPMSISDQGFHTLRIYFMCIIYVTT